MTTAGEIWRLIGFIALCVLLAGLTAFAIAMIWLVLLPRLT